MNRLNGIVPVVPIPFHRDETIDEVSFRRTVDFVASLGVAGMCLPAYYSEFYKLTEAERRWCVATAIETTRKRIPVIAQANHGSARVARQFAKDYESLGADMISFALPRQFGLSDSELLAYAGSIADAVSLPVLVQDYNPGGRTIGAGFIADLNKQHGNVVHVKLEEPLLTDKLVEIADAVGDRVTVFEGWGGYYMLEALAISNCAGVMPGVPIADLLNKVYWAYLDGDRLHAYDLFASLLPFISYELQNFELFLQIEKRLLVQQGLFELDISRAPSMTPSSAMDRYIDFLFERLGVIVRRETGGGFENASALAASPST